MTAVASSTHVQIVMDHTLSANSKDQQS